MLLREAMALARKAAPGGARRFALLSSFEPLHLKTYLQAYCVQRWPEQTPFVETFGYDQLREGLNRTASELKTSPAALFLSWEDIHPALSWRSRGPLGQAAAADIAEHAREFKGRLEAWVRGRPGVSVVALPPRSWLPPLGPQPSFGLSPDAAAAHAALWELAQALAAAGALVLDFSDGALNYRDLLIAGHPLTLEQCELAARRLVEAAYPASARKKALVLDLDGTLWNGVIGEDGPQALQHGDHGDGYPHHVLQKFAAKLKAEGSLLAFCSKNNASDVLPVFDSLGMPLKLSDFAAHRCNWESKAANLRSLAQELNIGVDSLVFVDDNAAELAEVARDLPEVERLRVPQDGTDWLAFFGRLQDLFGAWRLSDEDRLRTTSVTARQKADRSAPSQPPSGGAGHLRELRLQLAINPRAFDDPRSLELINKTNQFNLTGERMAADEWLAFARTPGAFCVSARLSDRYGDFGTICVASGRRDEHGVLLKQLVLSCRAFGRHVETLTLAQLLRDAAGGWIRGPFKETGKNEPTRLFLSGLGASVSSGSEWRLARETVEAAVRKVLEESGTVVKLEEGSHARHG